MKQKQKKNEDGFFRSIINELLNSVIANVIWNVIIFFPRVIFRV
ncbi:hypothetical protein [Psychrobacillus glaciei]|nr:hypothetical protein [Psychrobacillus glaciei]